jgi:Flp pilus assembly protein TadB
MPRSGVTGSPVSGWKTGPGPARAARARRAAEGAASDTASRAGSKSSAALARSPGRALRLTEVARQIESSRSRPPILRKAVAALVLVAVGVLVFHIVLNLVMAVFWIIAVIAVIAAVIWAANELF